MLKVKFRCALALFADDEKNQTIHSSTVFTIAKYTMSLE